MPRFAANLSFNPLKPMKPQTTNAVPNTTYADADSMQYSINTSGSAVEADMSNYAKKTDVPDVEFDWQGAGLVNPLDGKQILCKLFYILNHKTHILKSKAITKLKRFLCKPFDRYALCVYFFHTPFYITNFILFQCNICICICFEQTSSLFVN